MIKILVVDDDESILDAVSMILEDSGYKVGTLLKGGETYSKVEKFKPDLILLDVLISGNDGRHICKNLKQDLKTKNIPIVMISAHPSAKHGSKECGAEDFLSKPFESSELLIKVQKYTHRALQK
jgi:DNA-binding response OmpR family regulator